MQGISDLAAAIDMNVPRSYDSRSPSPVRDEYPRRFRETTSHSSLHYRLQSNDPAANRSGLGMLRQLLKAKPKLDTAALSIPDALKMLNGLATLLEQGSDSLATEAAEVLRSMLRLYPGLAPEVHAADIVGALDTALRHANVHIIPELQAAAVLALDTALGLLSSGDAENFPPAAAVAAPSLVDMFAPESHLMAVLALETSTIKAAVRCFSFLVKDGDPEVQDILLTSGAIPILTQISGASEDSQVKQLVGMILDVLMETHDSPEMQEAIQESDKVLAATKKLTAQATSTQLSGLLAILTEDVAEHAAAQSADMPMDRYTEVLRIFSPPASENPKSDLGKRLEKMFHDCQSCDDDEHLGRQIAFARSVGGQLGAMRHLCQERALRLLSEVTIEQEHCEYIVLQATIVPPLVAFLERPEDPAQGSSTFRMVAAFLGQLATHSLRLRAAILDAGAIKALTGLIVRRQPKLAEMAALTLAALQSKPPLEEVEAAQRDGLYDEDELGEAESKPETPKPSRGLFKRSPKKEITPPKKDGRRTSLAELASGEMPCSDLWALLQSQPPLYVPALIRLLSSRMPAVLHLAASCLASYAELATSSSKVLAVLKEAQAAAALAALLPIERLGQLEAVEHQQGALAAEAASAKDSGKPAKRSSLLSFPIIRGRSKSRELKNAKGEGASTSSGVTPSEDSQ